ncbi:Ig-like domain repeat protein [uncultured Methanobrevibacter sp.]|uniref:Ig-like domain repeat protein n=1 Tax=uncultured Methanobrevibacter sp. TaxID=253161 RepID=UPI0025FE6BB2|nr:Ig-like domain repeat protein [uncultured Methanobrevibacter sp.]
MNKREILIICLLLCIICSISAVSAADVHADDTNKTLATSDEEVVGASNDLSLSSISGEDILKTGGGSFTQLNEKINGDNSATIDLKMNYTYTSSDSAYVNGISFTKAITIDGHGYTIDGNNLARIFAIGYDGHDHSGTAGAVVLKNIIFANAYSNSGNQNQGFGAVEFYGVKPGSTLLIQNCTFLNNKAPTAAALSLGYSYDNIVNITNCTFDGNTATSLGGGAIRLRNNVANLKITNSVFKNNKASSSDGGAIHISSSGAGTLIKNCTFTSNEAYTLAGAISCSVDELTVDNCSFTSNSATNLGRAGAIYITGKKALINNSRFTDNSATYNSNVYGGGAIEVGSASVNSVINNCTFIGNHAQKGHGGAITSQNSVNLTINNSKFESNYAGSGGALFFESPTDLMMFNNTFKSNYVVGQFGGAIHFNTKTTNVHLLNSSFISNHATYGSNGRGGAIRFDSGNDNSFNYFYIYNVDFIDNHALQEGGAFSHNQRGKYFYFENCTFINCTTTATKSDVWGGGMYFNAIDSKLKNITFINCSSQKGGSLAIKWSTNTIFENITIINSSAGLVGGAVAVWDSNSVFANATIINSSAEGNGGAIYWGYMYGSSRPTGGNMYNVTIINSTSSANGGAIYWLESRGTLRLINIINASAQNGGGMYISGENIDIYDSNITNSTSTYDGGALYFNTNYHKVTNCTFEGCNATRYGGAVYVGSYIYIYFYDSTFNDSYAYNGGAFYYAGSVGTIVSIHNSTFTNNIASHNGGAIYYVVVDDTGSDDTVIYRDYNNFDDEGDISAGRTTLTMKSSAGSTYVKRIDDCYFKGNEDYILAMTASSATDTVLGTVIVSRPKDPNGHDFTLVINITKDDALVTQIILDSYQDYVDYFRTAGFVVSTRVNLTRDTEYNVTVGFEDSAYLYKEAKSSFRTADTFERGDFKILQRLIDEAISGNKTVNLTRDYIFTAVEDWGGKVQDPDDWCMNITDTITINGNGYSIDALAYARIFNITGENVIINDVRLINGNTSGIYNDNIVHTGKTKAYGDGIQKGGAIFWAGKNGVINNSVVSNNFAEYGGGIYFNSTATDCNVTNNIFSTNNATKNGGAIECNASNMRLYNTTFQLNRAENGAALCREASATNGSGRNNTFISNHATIAGAALAWMKAENIYIDTYKFKDNTAEFSGGAIYVGIGSTNCTVFNSTFVGNNVTSLSEGHGGAIEWYADTGRILNSTFTNNNAYTGGAIYVGKDPNKDDAGHINITNSGFIGNNAITLGGAIDLVASSVAVNNSYFRENTAENGGAIFAGGTGDNNYVYSAVFMYNNATVRGGAVNWNSTAGRIEKSNFTGNLAEHGGAVYIGGSSPNSRIENVIFKQNNATRNGGAIDWNATGGQLYNTQFISNYAGEYGAALCRESGATGGSGKNNTFKYNHADIAGAALAWLNVTGIHINDYKFYYNTANASGAAIFIGNGSDNSGINGSVFVGNNITNETGGHGGAIDIVADNTNVTNSNFTNNNAFYGGAIFVGSKSGNTHIADTTFRDNTAEVDGGAINLQASGVTLNGTKFVWNVAHRNGGGIYVGGVGTTNKIYNSNFTSNVAYNNGGAVYWRAYAGHIEYTNFTLNSAINGGAIYLNGVSNNTNITHAIFTDNNALGNGGAIDCNSTKMNLTYTLFESNYAGAYGAALCREQGATNGSGHHNEFKYNHAGIAGAALAWLNVKNITIDYYNFTGNYADEMGGAIYASVGSDNFTINHCNFKDNNVTNAAAGHGGAIDIDSDNNKIINSNFTNNNAYDGGAIHVGSASGHTNITDVTFKKNNAFHDGGAINLEASGVRLNKTKFYNNTAGNNGGAVYVGGVGTTNVVFDSDFESNKAGNRGGAVDWLAQKGEIKYTNFTDNEAVYGGALYLNGASSGSELSHLIFKDNFASKNGGAIDCNATLVNLTHTKFVTNTAEFGAALCREKGATGGFGENNTFVKNHATKSGAALAWLGVSNIHINNYTFTNNTADYSGGAIYVGPGSDNCIVDNCSFDENYISNAIEGRGGAIDWIGNNGTVMNTTFNKCISINAGAIYVDDKSDNMTIKNVSFTECNSLTNGGALVLRGNNVTILDSNFTSCSARDCGGAIAGFTSDNANITNIHFKYNVVGIRIDPQGVPYGEGGAIYWENSKNITVKDSSFESNEAHLSGGSISADNCNDSLIYNIITHDETAFRNGGSIAWVNSDNVTINKATFNDSGANYKGGTLYLSNINATVKNSLINYTWASWDRGGGMYVDGNVTIDTVKFNDTHVDEDNASAIYFNSGISRVINSTFTNSFNSIGIAKGANVTLTRNNLTADDPNKSLPYLEDNSTLGVEKTKYSIWNDGDLYLERNNFDYLIFNNGIIHTQTYMDILANDTWNVTWNSTFTFFANITDDNNNSIISVKNLKTWNNESMGGYFNMSYNQFKTNTYYQANFIIYGSDIGLAKCTNRSGTINVKMPIKIELTHTGDPDGDRVVITATITPKYTSNYTLSGKVHFKMGTAEYDADVLNGVAKWLVATAEWNLNNLAEGTHKVTATYDEDDHHLGAQNETSFLTNLRNSWLIVHINSVAYGENATVTITTNSNGTVRFNLHGKDKIIVVPTIKKGENYVGEFNLTKENYTTVGIHSAGVVLEANEYYAFNMNQTSFEIYCLNTTIHATPTTSIKVGQVETITVQLNESARGFVELSLSNGDSYYQKVNSTGGAQFNIVGLPNGTYRGTVTYLGDDIFNGNHTDILFIVSETDDYNITVKVNNVKLGGNATIYVVLPMGVSENLTVYVNNTKYENVTVNNGLAILNVNNTVLNAPGQYVVNVTYPGDSVYALNYNNGTKFNVLATDDWTLKLNVEAHQYGQNTIFTVTLPIDVEGKKLNLTIDGLNHTVTINDDGVGTLTLNNISGGLHTVTANYTGDSRYVTKTNSTNFLVEKAASTTTITQDVNGDVKATVTTNATGTVTFFVNGRNYTVDLVNNVALLDKNNLTIGNNSIVAIYNGDINFTSSKGFKNITIAKNTALVNASATNETYGVPTEITVKVPKAQTGYVTITVNDTLVNVTVKIVNGEAKFNATGLGVGKYIVNVTYLGDETYDVATNHTYFNITKNSNLVVDVIGQNVTVKENPSFVVNITDDFSGKVNITIGGVSYYDDDVKSLIGIDKLPAGTYMANATFYGDSNYGNKSVEVEFKVSRVTPTINVTIDDVTYPTKSIAVVNVSDYANGTINITVDGKVFNGTVTNGVATIDLKGLSAGVKDALVNFTASDDDKYNFNATENVKFHIVKAKSTIVITQENQNVIATVTPGATGNVTFYINGKKYSKEVDNGRAILENVLLNGNNTVVAIYSGDANFTSAFNATNNTVGLKDALVNVSATTVVYGNDSVITVKVPKVQKGYVRVVVNGTDIDVVLEIKDGIATFNATDLKAGRYKVNVTYLGDGTYGIKENSTYFNISKANLTASVIAQNVTVNENISFIVSVLNDFNGNVSIEVDGKIYNGTVKTFIEMEQLLKGAKQATVTFYGDNNYNIKVIEPTFTVSAVEPTINVTITDTTYPNNATATVKVSGKANGTIEIKVGDKTYTKEITNGLTVIELDGLNAGLKEANVTFTSSDDYNLNANASYKFFIKKAQSHIEINVTPSGLSAGGDAKINITVSCTGKPVVYIDDQIINDKELENNRIIIDKTKLTVGKHTVVVYYPGDNNYESSSESYTFTVDKHEAMVNVTVKDTPYNEMAQITVEVPIAQTGYVTITVANKNYTTKIDKGVAVFNVTGLDVDKYTVNVTYEGDENYTVQTNDTTFNVTQINLKPTVLAVNVTDAMNSTFIIVVPNDYKGQVTITVDGETYSGNVNSIIQMGKLTVGEKEAHVVFADDKNYKGTELDVTFNVTKAEKQLPVTTVVNSTTVVVTVPENVTGNVTVVLPNGTNKTVIIDNGSVTITLENMTPGVNNITVIYTDGNNTVTTNATITVPKYDTQMNVTVTEAKAGGNATVTVEVPINATGTIIVTLDGKTYTTDNITGGKAIITIENLTAGDKTLIVEYSGDSNYSANYTLSNFTVSPGKVEPDMNVVDLGNGTVVIVVGDNATGNVTVKVGDNIYNATVINGTAIVNINNETPGIHDIEVIYSGDGNHTNATANATVTTPKYDSDVDVTVTELENGTVVVNVEVPTNATGNVTVNVGGKEYVTEVKEDGKATVYVDNIAPGNHTVAVEYSGDDNYSGNYTISNFTKEAGKSDVEPVVIDQGNGTVVIVVGDNATGNVTVKVGNNTYNATVINGTAIVNIGNETPGVHEVEVIYSGDDTHTNATETANITAPKYDTGINVTVGEAKEGEPFTITVEVPQNATGDVIVNVGGQNYTGTIENGKAVVTVENVSAGNHTIAVEYIGDDNYNGNYSVSKVTVEPAKVTPDVRVIDQGNGTVVVVVGDNATGNVTIKVGDKEYNATVVNGTAVVTLDNITPGEQNITVVYSGDDTHNATTANATVVGPKYDAPVDVNVTKDGQTATITVTVPENATGNVTVTIDGHEYPGTIENGKAVVTVDNLTPGDKTVIVEYSGDDNYASNYTISNFTIDQPKVDSDVKVIDQGNGTIVVVVGDNATGNVTVTVDGQNYTAEVINGTAVVTLDNVTPGTHDIEVIYSGDDTHSNATANATIDVSKRSTPISIDVENIKVGDKAVIKVNVAKDCDGNVTIEIDGKKYTEIVTDGVATFEIEGLTAGNKSVFAVYNGDAKYEENYTSEQFDVGKVDSKLTVSIKDIRVGENITITVEVPSDATGQVLIDIDGVGYYLNVTDGKGTAEIPHLTAGSYNVTLTYTGDDKYLSSSNATTVKVSKLESFVIPIAHNIYVGENENIRLLVPSDATGNVTVVIDGEAFNFNLDTGVLGAVYSEGAKYNVAISGGNGELVISGLPKGEYTVSVMYNGDEKYLPAVNTTIFTVSKATTPMDVVDQGNGTIVVTVPENATGNVTVTVDNVTYTSEVVDGKAVITLENTTPGKHDITVEYSGDNNYASNSTQLVADIPKYATPISVEVEDINVGDVEIVTVTLPEKATGKVTIEINGKEYTTDVENGKAIFEVPDLAFGNKTVAVKYSGDDSYNDNYTTGQFVVSKVPSSISAVGKDITVGKDEVITVTVPSDATGKVLITIDGVGYYGEITNGKAKIIIPELPAGKYSATVTYEGDDKYLESTAPVSFTVNKVKAPVRAEADDINEGEDATVIVHVPSDATGTVTITIDGKQYTAEVDNGVAVFVIPGLTRGDHNIVAFYSGDDKYDANDNITDIEVLYSQPDVPDNNGSEGKHAGAGVMLSEYATGNPILVLLLLLMIGSTQIRRFKK